MERYLVQWTPVYHYWRLIDTWTGSTVRTWDSENFEGKYRA